MEPPRETISLLLTSILGGLALTYSIAEIQGQLANKGFSTPLYSILLFIIFISIWLRFVPGNLSHIRKLERWPNTSVNTWLLDVSVITLESMVMIFMATPSVTNPAMFFYSLLVLLFLDIFWLALMLPGVKAKTRPEPPWIWLRLNIPSTALVVILLLLHNLSPQILYPTIYSLQSILPLVVITIVFCLLAFVDIMRTAPDWYGRPRDLELSTQQRKELEKHMREAIEEAKKSLLENGIPVGAVLVENGNVIGRGHNRRVQDNNPVGHAEIECLKTARRKQGYTGTTLFSTLMPCCMCAGAIVHLGIRKVVVGAAEAKHFEGARSFLENCGVLVIVLDIDECREMLSQYIESNPTIWNEDIGKS